MNANNANSNTNQESMTLRVLEANPSASPASPSIRSSQPVPPPTSQQPTLTPLENLNPEDVKTMNIHQLADLVGRLEREMSEPTENQEDPTGKLVGNQWEIPENT